MMRRDLLLTRVHPILREQLREKISKRPETTSHEVYEHLRKHFSIDDPHYWRKKWVEVRLRCQGDRIELAELLLFRSKFETALSKVTDWTETEVIDNLMKNLPPLLGPRSGQGGGQAVQECCGDQVDWGSGPVPRPGEAHHGAGLGTSGQRDTDERSDSD